MELIAAPRFATLGADDSPWQILTHQGVTMEPTVVDGVLSLQISGTHGANWHAELRYAPFEVEVGEIFHVSFAARCEQPIKFSVWLGQRDEPYASLVPEDNHFGEALMTPEWKAFGHTWHPHIDEPLARLNFVLGPIDNRVDLRDVSLTKAATGGPIR